MWTASRTTFLAIMLLLSMLAQGQSNSPDALYERGIDAITGVGPSHNDQQGVDYFKRSADLGYGPAQIALGYYYETGMVVQADPAQSLELYRKAAQTGDPLAAWLVGRRYFLGNGVARDLAAAQKWFRLSADQNSAYGAYYYGRVISDRDPVKATSLFKFAAEQGLPQAQYFYGKSLKDGHGVPQDRLNAYVWLAVANDAGYATAAADLTELETGGVMTPDQVTDAKTRARDLEQIVVRAVNSRGCAGWDGEFAEFPTPPPPKLQRFCH
jgi:hypothetical protein